MNEHDRGNLDFLLKISPETFDDWLQQASADDVDYALELMQQAKLELILQKIEIMDEVEDLSLAESVLSNIIDKIK